MIARGVGAAEDEADAEVLRRVGVVGARHLLCQRFRGLTRCRGRVRVYGAAGSNAFGRGGAWIARFAPEHQYALPAFLEALSTGAAPNCCDSSREIGEAFCVNRCSPRAVEDAVTAAFSGCEQQLEGLSFLAPCCPRNSPLSLRESPRVRPRGVSSLETAFER